MNHAKLNTKFASNVENKDILKNAVTTFLFTTAATAEAMTTMVAATAIQKDMRMNLTNNLKKPNHNYIQIYVTCSVLCNTYFSVFISKSIFFKTSS